jgi:biopolymer transport protein ExbD
MSNNKKTLIQIICLVLVVALIIVFAVLTITSKKEIMLPTENTDKPVIYLYPEQETEVTVTLDYSGVLTTTYPEYNDGWTVTARPDGTLTDSDGKSYNYLFWEGKTNTEYDFSRGFCVAGEDTAEFLETALSNLGLTRREANEFIVFWLPRMQENEYNLIAFQDNAYTDSAVLDIAPQPDSVLRVFMAWRSLEKAVDIEPQEFDGFQRSGFTVVEWGGCEVK